jgi:hypothetical protein
MPLYKLNYQLCVACTTKPLKYIYSLLVCFCSRYICVMVRFSVPNINHVNAS